MSRFAMARVPWQLRKSKHLEQGGSFPITPACDGIHCERTPAPLETSIVPWRAISRERSGLADMQLRKLNRAHRESVTRRHCVEVDDEGPLANLCCRGKNYLS